MVVLATLLLSGCATLRPGSDSEGSLPNTLTHPDQNAPRAPAGCRIGHGTRPVRLQAAAESGVDSFLLRMEMAAAAERTLDVQYFLIQSDDTGQLLIEALLKAADRGVRVRVLLDDAGSFGRDAQIRTLARLSQCRAAASSIRSSTAATVRSFTPPSMLGDGERLNYRMHNKLLVVDNEIGIVGGRNVGDEYFQGGRDFEFGDYDIIAAGPIVKQMSNSFDAFWNSPMAIPIEAFAGGKPTRQRSTTIAASSPRTTRMMKATRRTCSASAGEPLAAMLAGNVVARLGQGGTDLRQSGKGEGAGRRTGGPAAATSPRRSGEGSAVGAAHRVAVSGARGPPE